MPYSATRMLAPKITYSARNSAGRIYPSLVSSHFLATLLLQNMEHLVKILPYYLKSKENW